MTRLGYQIPNFTYPDVGPAELFDVVTAQAKGEGRPGRLLRSADEQGVWLSNFMWGDPDTVGEQSAAMLVPGIDGFTINIA